jgi:FkbM family methyltransferase
MGAFATSSTPYAIVETCRLAAAFVLGAVLSVLVVREWEPTSLRSSGSAVALAAASACTSNDYFVQRLERLKHLNFTPKGICDIGANEGDWTRTVKKIWPRSPFFMVEGNYKHIQSLKAVGEQFAITYLGDRLRNVTMWEDPGDKITVTNGHTGNSIFRENGEHASFVNATRPMLTLDMLSKQRRMPPCNLLKLDVQGAELLVLRGAAATLRHVEVITMELAVVQYNDGAPLWFETHVELDQLGFVAWDVLQLHYDGNTLIQLDVLFVRKDSPLTKKRATGYPAPKLPSLTCKKTHHDRGLVKPRATPLNTE